MIISLTAHKKWRIYQIDVKLAFLNRILKEKIYVEQLMSYVIKGQENKMLKLKKIMYGLKQVPRVWNSQTDKYFKKNEFTKCSP